MIFRDETLFQVTQSVTRNGKSILLTMMLALILIYLFSLVGFIFFRDDFLTHIQTTFISFVSTSTENNDIDAYVKCIFVVVVVVVRIDEREKKTSVEIKIDLCLLSSFF